MKLAAGCSKQKTFVVISSINMTNGGMNGRIGCRLSEVGGGWLMVDRMVANGWWGEVLECVAMNNCIDEQS